MWKNYTPPETDEDLPEKERKSHDTEENRLKIDSWSLGTILYQLCVGIYPFKSLYDKHKGMYIKALPENYTNIMYNLIEGLLMYPPKDRYNLK